MVQSSAGCQRSDRGLVETFGTQPRLAARSPFRLQPPSSKLLHCFCTSKLFPACTKGLRFKHFLYHLSHPSASYGPNYGLPTERLHPISMLQHPFFQWLCPWLLGPWRTDDVNLKILIGKALNGLKCFGSFPTSYSSYGELPTEQASQSSRCNHCSPCCFAIQRIYGPLGLCK